MTWNPEVYNQFKEKREQPFYDLISRVKIRPGLKILDLGCGTGELTLTLPQRFPGSSILGVDNSREMLPVTNEFPAVTFALRSIVEELMLPTKYDLIIANASLQWVDDHQQLFRRIISKLNPSGQIAIQMPSQNENVLNKILFELVNELPYYNDLKNLIHHSPVLSLDEYTKLLILNGGMDVNVSKKVYPIVADSIETLYAFISGSALRPYLGKLSGEMRKAFINDYKERIGRHFKSSPMIYSFKRILLTASFS